MNLVEILIAATENAKRHSWGDMSMLEHIALFTEEMGEACECIRKGDNGLRFADDGKPEGLASELADIVIRVAYMAGRFNIPLVEAVEKKLEYNKKRPKNHGKKI